MLIWEDPPTEYQIERERWPGDMGRKKEEGTDTYSLHANSEY